MAFFTGHCVAEFKPACDSTGLAVVGGQLVSGGQFGNTLQVWCLSTGQNEVSMEGYGERIAALSGGHFASINAGRGTPAKVWDATTGKLICELQGPKENYCVASVSQGHWVATGSYDGTVHISDAATGAHVATLEGHTACVRALQQLPEGWLASGSSDHTVRLWDTSSFTCTAVLKHDSTANAFASVPGHYMGGGRTAIGCDDHKIYLWDVGSGTREGFLEGHTASVQCLAYLDYHDVLASGGYDAIRVWRVAARTCVAVMKGYETGIPTLVALPDGRRLASGCETDDDVIRVWELRTAADPPDLGAASQCPPQAARPPEQCAAPQCPPQAAHPQQLPQCPPQPAHPQQLLPPH